MPNNMRPTNHNGFDYELECLDCIKRTIGEGNYLEIQAKENANRIYCECTRRDDFFSDKVLIFIEAGVGNGWLTPTGKEHRIEILVYFPNGKRLYVDAKSLTTDSYLYNGSRNIIRAGGMDDEVIFQYFGKVINSSDFRLFIKEKFIPPNVTIYDSLRSLERRIQCYL